MPFVKYFQDGEGFLPRKRKKNRAGIVCLVLLNVLVHILVLSFEACMIDLVFTGPS